MAKYYRANNKRGYLSARIIPSDSQMVLQDVEYYDPAVPTDSYKDRNIPVIVNKLMRLVIWGIQYPNPSADPNKEIISATWSGTGQIFDIIRAQEGTDAGEHYTGDNVALLFTADMSREILIFEDFEESIPGSIAYTEDTDEDGEMEVLALPPDNEVVITPIIIPPELVLYDSYTEGIDFQETVYWIGGSHVWQTQTFTPEVSHNIDSIILKLYRTGDAPGNVTISIRATDIVTGKPTGPDIRVKAVNGNGITTDSGGEEILFTFASSYSFVAGTKYAIILKHPVAQIPAYVHWKSKKANTGYPGHIFYSHDAGATWNDDYLNEGGSFYFKIYGYTDEDIEYVEEEFKKILVSGGIGNPPYWQFIWAEEVGGTRRV